MADLGIRMLIDVENRASDELKKLPADVERLRTQMGALDKSTSSSAQSMRDARQAVRLMSGSLTSELGPALGTTGSAVARLVDTTIALGTRFNVVGVAAIGLAGIIAGQLFEAWQKARKEQEAYLEAMTSGDIGRMTAAVNEQTVAIRRLGDAYADLEAKRGTRSLSDLLSLSSPEARRQAIGGEIGEKLDRHAAGLRAVTETQRSIDFARAEEQGMVDANAYIRQQRILREQRAAAAAQDARDLANRLRRDRFGTDFGGDEGLAFLGGRPLSQVVADQEDSPTVLAYRQALLAGRRDVDLAFSGQDEGLAFTGGTTSQGVQDLIRKEVAGMRELAEAQKKLDDQMQEMLERTDPAAGLAKGFRDMTREAGEIMQDFAVSTAQSMNTAFSDLFFNAMTGNFKSLADVGKQFGLSLARNVSDALAQGLTSQITSGLGGLAGAARGFFPDSGMSLLNIAPAGQQQNASLQRAGYSFGGEGTYAPSTGVRAGGLYSSLGFVGDSQEFGAGSYAGAQPSAGGFNASNFAGVGVGLGVLGLSLLASNSSGRQAGVFSAGASGLALGYSAGAFGAGLAGLTGIAAATTATGVGAMVAVLAMIAMSAVQGPKNTTDRGERLIELAHVVDADVTRVRGAGTFLELADAIRMALHQAYGGPPGRGRGTATAGFAATIAGQDVVLPGGSYPATMTLGELAVFLETSGDTFSAQLQLGSQAVQSVSSTFTDAVRNQAQIVRTLASSQVAYEESGAGLLRTTMIPLSAAGSVEPGRYAMSLNRGPARDAGLTDELIDMLTKRSLSRNSQTDRIPDWSRELQFVV